MMPGGDAEAYKYLQPIVEKVAAQTDDGACVTYVGVGGAGMVFISLDVCVLFFYLWKQEQFCPRNVNHLKLLFTICLLFAGNYVKMVHNGIEYGDMQLISEAYDVLKTVGGLSNEELAAVFDEWNNTELESFLVEITASIFKKKDELADGFLVDKVQDKTGMKVREKKKQKLFRLMGSNHGPRGYGPRTLPLRQVERW